VSTSRRTAGDAPRNETPPQPDRAAPDPLALLSGGAELAKVLAAVASQAEARLPDTVCVLATCDDEADLGALRVVAAPTLAAAAIDTLQRWLSTSHAQAFDEVLRRSVGVKTVKLDRRGAGAALRDAGFAALSALPLNPDRSPAEGLLILLHRASARFGTIDGARLLDLQRIAGLAVNRERRHQALETVDRRFAGVIANLPGVVFQREVAADGRMRYTYISEGVRDLFGLSPSRVLMDAAALANCIDAAYRRRVIDDARRASRTLGAWDAEMPITTIAGERKWIRTIARPQPQPDGTVLWDGIIFDVSRRRDAEMAASAAQARLSEAIEAFSEGFALFDRGDRLIAFNRGYVELCRPIAELLRPGVTFEAIVRAAVAAGMMGDVGDDPEAWIARRLVQHRAPGAPFEHAYGDGRWFIVNERRTADGGIVIVFSDITGIKRREAELARQSLLLQATLDNIDQGVSVMDDELRLVAFNRRFLDLLEFPAELGRIGTPFAEFIRHNARRGEYGPGDIERQVEERVALARHFKAHRFERVRPNGAVLEIVGNPMPKGGLVTTYTDVTARKDSEREIIAAKDLAERAVAQIAAANRQLDIALDNMAQGLVLYDADQRLVLWNRRVAEIYRLPATLLRPGITLRELTEHSARAGTFPGDKAEEMLEERLRYAASGVRRTFLQRLADGRIIEVAHQPLADGGAVVTFSDVTERERTQRALQASEARQRERVLELEDTRARLEEQGRELVALAESLARARDEAETASRTKSAFLANMSHELRTPLNAVIGFSEVMMSELFGPLGDARYGEYARSIHASGRHLLDLINDILDLSKVEAGKIELREEPCYIADIVDACGRLMWERARTSGIAIEIDVARGLPPLRLDPIKIKQVLLNLISNAIKFTPTGGRIAVSGRRDELGVLLAVRDTGIGMRPEDVPLALQPFGQIDNALSRSHAGTGLGLPLSKALVELHGGSLEIDSAPGEGVTVRVRLPANRIIQEATGSQMVRR
jgi:two-component system cell cycle sensor histidine kinase PleC